MSADSQVSYIDSICCGFVLNDARFDDTNPGKEEGKYFVEIEKTIRWLGLPWTSTNYQCMC